VVLYIYLLTKTLEELKEMAVKHLSMQLEMMEELSSLSFQDVMYFIPWYTNHPIQDKIVEQSKNMALLRNTTNNTTTSTTRQ
jgi:hypothetical protein